MLLVCILISGIKHKSYDLNICFFYFQLGSFARKSDKHKYSSINMFFLESHLTNLTFSKNNYSTKKRTYALHVGSIQSLKIQFSSTFVSFFGILNHFTYILYCFVSIFEFLTLILLNFKQIFHMDQYCILLNLIHQLSSIFFHLLMH